MLSSFITSPIGEAIFVGLAATVAVAAAIVIVAAVVSITVTAGPVLIAAGVIGIAAGVGYGLYHSGASGSGNGDVVTNAAMVKQDDELPTPPPNVPPDKLIVDSEFQKYRLVVRYDSSDLEVLKSTPYRFNLSTSVNGEQDGSSRIAESGLNSLETEFRKSIRSWLDLHQRDMPGNDIEVFLVKPLPGTEVSDRMRSIIGEVGGERHLPIRFGIVSEQSFYLN